MDTTAPFDQIRLLSQEQAESAKVEELFKETQQFEELMMMYDCAIRQVKTRLEILDEEFSVRYRRNPISSIQSRVKSPFSIYRKLKKLGEEPTIRNISRNLNDVAGVRVICNFIDDIYDIARMLGRQDDLKVITVKDYIKSPKESGYRSLHLVIEIPVYLSESTHRVKVEVQLRTIAMDFWACLEHELHYKTTTNVPESVRRELFRVAETIAMTDREMEEIAIELQALD